MMKLMILTSEEMAELQDALYELAEDSYENTTDESLRTYKVGLFKRIAKILGLEATNDETNDTY